MATTAGKQTIRPSEPQRERLSAGEWPVMRACWRLGPEPTTGEIVREVQRDFECGSVTVWGPPENRGQITQTAC